MAMEFGYTLRIDDIIMCRDGDKNWLPAEITKASLKYVHVRYFAWNPKYNEWIPRNSERLKPYCKQQNSHPSRSPVSSDDPYMERKIVASDVKLNQGDIIDCLDKKNRWCVAEIIDTLDSSVRVHYLGWDDDYNEWILRSSDRLKSLRSKTSNKK
jgi:hypothetical protein